MVNDVGREWLVEGQNAPYLRGNKILDKYETASPILKAVLIPRGLRIYLFLKEREFIFHLKIVPILCSSTILIELAINTNGNMIWKGDKAEYYSALPMI